MRVIEVMCAAVIAGPQATAKGLRHGFAVACIPKNIPLNLVQRWLGHAYISTTAIYANTIGEEEHSIAARLDMTDPYNSFRQLENLLRQQEQIQRFATSTLLQDVAEQFRKGEQIQRLATSSLVHNTVEQFIREQEQLRRLATSSFLQDAAEQFIRQREHLGQLKQDPVANELLRQSWLAVESAIRLQDFYREITIGDESVSVLEVEEAVQSFFSSIGDSYFFETFLERFRCLKDSAKPIVFSLLMCVIIPCFINLSSSIIYDFIIKNEIQPYIDNTSPQSSREVKRSIKNMPDEIDFRNLEGFRIITGDNVRIREQPNTRSRVTRELKRGKIVKSSRKEKKLDID